MSDNNPPTQDEGGALRSALIDARLTSETFTASDGYTSVRIRSDEEAADVALKVFAALAAPTSAEPEIGWNCRGCIEVNERGMRWFAAGPNCPVHSAASAEPECVCGGHGYFVEVNTGTYPCKCAEPSEDEREDDLDFGIKKHCSCMSSFDGEGDGMCPVHWAPGPVSRDAELIAEAKAHNFWSIKNDAGKTLDLIRRLVAAYEEATK